MSSLITHALVGFACLFAGWFLLPAPARIQKWYEDMGWTDRVK
jgi:hypothetical protein